MLDENTMPPTTTSLPEAASNNPTNANVPTGLVNFGNPDRDLADEFKDVEKEETHTLPSGREVRSNDTEPFYGILSPAEEAYLANPTGTLTLHVIHGKSLNTSVIRRIFPTATVLDFYVRIDFLDRQFFSKLITDIPVDNEQIIFDFLLSFSIDDILLDEGNESQVVTFHVIALDEAQHQRHIVVGQAQKPILAFIRSMIASELIPLSRPAKINPVNGGYEGTRPMGTLLIKSAFAYGKFGYGHSNQWKDERMVASDAIKLWMTGVQYTVRLKTNAYFSRHSLMPRVAPPLDRVQDAGRVLRYKNLPLLDVYPFPVREARIGNPLLRLDYTTGTDAEEQAIRQALPWMNVEPKYVRQLSQKLFTDWKIKLSSFGCGTTRKIAFLKDTCSASAN